MLASIHKNSLSVQFKVNTSGCVYALVHYREVVLTPLQSAGADVCADSDSWEYYMLLRRPDDQGARMCRRGRD
jgi:hypothetical protein